MTTTWPQRDPASRVLLNEDFNNALTGWTTDVGASFIDTSTAGEIRYKGGAGGEARFHCSADLAATDLDFVALITRLTTDASGVDIMVRWASDTSHILLNYQRTSIGGFKCVGGTYTALGSAVNTSSAINNDAPIWMWGRCIGNVISLNLTNTPPGVKRISTQDAGVNYRYDFTGDAQATAIQGTRVGVRFAGYTGANTPLAVNRVGVLSYPAADRNWMP